MAAARRVDLVDASGQKRVVVHTAKDGPVLVLFDKNDEFLAILCMTENGPVKTLFCEKDELGAVLDVPTDTMHLNLYGAALSKSPERNLKSSLGMDDLPSIVELRSAEDKMQVCIRVGAANLEFLLHDMNSRMRASLAMGKGVGHLRLFDKKGEPIWSAP